MLFDNSVNPFPPPGVEVRLHLYPEGTPSPGAGCRPDDAVCTVSARLSSELAGAVYWCVWTTRATGDDVDALVDALDGDVAAAHAALFGRPPKGTTTRDAVVAQAAKGAYMCPFAVAGHPSSLPNAVTPVPGGRLLEALYDTRVSHVLATPAAPAWRAPFDDGRDVGTDDAAVAALCDGRSEDRPPTVPHGPAVVAVRHALCPDGVVVRDDALPRLFESISPAPEVAVVAMSTEQGALALRAHVPSVRAGLVDPVLIDRSCRNMIRRAGAELLIVGPDASKVRVSTELVADVYLRTRGDVVQAIRDVVASPPLARAVRLVTGKRVAPVPDDVLDRAAYFTVRYAVEGGVAALVAALDRNWGLLTYTRTEQGVDVTLARTPGYDAPTAERAFLMRKHALLTQGRAAQLARDLAAKFGKTAAEARADVDAYRSSLPRRSESKGSALPPNGLVASVVAGGRGLVITIETTAPVVYAERLLWCIRGCLAGRSAAAAPASRAADTSGDTTQDILRRLQADAPAPHAEEVASRYVLTRLYDADAELFTRARTPGFQTYSKICGAVDGRQPIALDAAQLAAVRASGSEVEALEVRGRSYICPEVWCPTTQRAMTLEEYRAAGRRCPDGSRGVDMTDSKYWKGNPPRYPGVLAAEKHPAGLCMPCCFKRRKGAAAEASAYVLASGNAPLPPGRHGLVDGFPAGLVRVGVEEPSAFLSSVAFCLDRDVDDVVRDLRAACTTKNVLAVKDLASRFIDFKRCFSRKEAFAAFVKTAAGKDHLVACGAVGAKPGEARHTRALAVYDAVATYAKYVATGVHTFVLPVLQIAFPKVAFCVYESLEDGTLLVHAALGAPGAARPESAAVIVKTVTAYEPVVDAKTKEGPTLGNAVVRRAQQVQTQARMLQGERHLQRLQRELRERDIALRAIVLSSDLDCVGAMTVDGVFVPFPSPDSAVADFRLDIVWYDDLPSFADKTASAKAVAAFLEDLAEATGWPHLAGATPVSSRGAVVAYRVGAWIVPVRPGPAVAVLFRDARDAVAQFVRQRSSAPRNRTAAVVAMLDAMHEYLGKHHLEEYFVLRHPLCPYPRDVRYARLMELSSPVWSGAADDAVARSVNMLVTRQKRPHASSSAACDDCLTATEEDVLDGGLGAALAMLAAPEDAVDAVRMAIAAADQSELDAEPARLEGAWFNPGKGLTMFGVADDDVARAADAVRRASGQADAPKRYADELVGAVVRAIELGQSLEGLSMDRRTRAMAGEETEKARQSAGSLRRRLRTRFLTDDDFAAGPGDVARRISGPDVRVLALHPSGYYVAGGEGRCVVVALEKGRLYVARGPEGVALEAKDIPPGARRLLRSPA